MLKTFAAIIAACCVTAAALLAQTAAGVRWTPPAGWQAQPAQAMRAATYAVQPAPGDKTPGECAVYFFGAGQGGSIEDNLERWKSQFKTADGKPAPAQVGTKTVRGMKVTTIDASGDYSGLGGPMAPAHPVAGYRLLGAIVEAPGGNIFVKFTAPLKTVAANQQKFDQLLASFQPAR
jgi:hypothetical protein